MLEHEIKIRVEAGHPSVNCVVIMPRLMLEGYQLMFGSSETVLEMTMSSKRESVRVFKTIDTANRVAKKLGFQRVIVINLEQ